MRSGARAKKGPGVTWDRDGWYYVRRVPTRLVGKVNGPSGQPVRFVRICLHTDSVEEANSRAVRVAERVVAEWAAIEAGHMEDARAHYEAARALASAKGVPYVPLADLAKGGLDDLVGRLLSLGNDGQLTASPEEVAAVLGAVDPAMPALPEMWEEWADLTRTQRKNKSAAQEKKWRQPRERAVARFLEVAAPKGEDGTVLPLPVNQITRAHALAFRDFHAKRVDEGMSVSAANKELDALNRIFREWCELKGHEELNNPFARLHLKGRDKSRRVPYSRDFVRDRILAPGAMDGLNEEARDVVLVMVNTALGPAEIVDAALSDWHLDAPVPYLDVTDNGRELKTDHRGREIPLLGVSLEAARRIVARGGSRYAHKANSLSALVNKYFRNNGLEEKPGTTLYSLRHCCEDAMLAAKVDYRVRRDILGHKLDAPVYGDGGGLKGRRDALALIAL